MPTLVLWMIAACGLGAGFVAWGVRMGKEKARLEDKLKAANDCKEAHEIPFINPSMVSCPCQCGGILETEGRNTKDTLTFLDCNKCGCCYVAGDVKKEKRAS